MKASTLAIGAAACVLFAGCDRGFTDADAGVEQTKFPGQVTAGGLTSGQVIARSPKPETNATYAGGTPGIAGGSGGTTGGAALGGTVSETGSGPSSGVTPPSGAMQGGNKPPGEYQGPPPNAPAAGVTPVGAGTATHQEGAPVPSNNAARPSAPDAPAQQPAKPPAAPGTLTGDK